MCHLWDELISKNRCHLHQMLNVVIHMLFVIDFLSLSSVILKLIFSLAELTLNPPEGIVAGPINEENFFEWETLIT